MTTSTATIITGLQAAGGFPDHKQLATKLALASGLTEVFVKGGANLVAGNVAFVQDGSSVALPVSPATSSIVVVVNCTPAMPVVVTGTGGPWTVGGPCLAFVWSGSAWTVY